MNFIFSSLSSSAYPLKDNRLAPLGFTTSHQVYDTTLIVGNALLDMDFNHESGMEGSASDRVHFRFDRTHFNGGFVHISARIYYQSLPPKWMEEIFSVSTPEIDLFKSMYDEADQSPVLIAEEIIDSFFLDFIISTEDPFLSETVVLYPNPSKNGWLHCQVPSNQQLERIEVYDLQGRLLNDHQNVHFQLPTQHGIYIVKVITDKTQLTKKIMHMK